MGLEMKMLLVLMCCVFLCVCLWCCELWCLLWFVFALGFLCWLTTSTKKPVHVLHIDVDDLNDEDNSLADDESGDEHDVPLPTKTVMVPKLVDAATQTQPQVADAETQTQHSMEFKVPGYKGRKKRGEGEDAYTCAFTCVHVCVACVW